MAKRLSAKIHEVLDEHLMTVNGMRFFLQKAAEMRDRMFKAAEKIEDPVKRSNAERLAFEKYETALRCVKISADTSIGLEKIMHPEEDPIAGALLKVGDRVTSPLLTDLLSGRGTAAEKLREEKANKLPDPGRSGSVDENNS